MNKDKQPEALRIADSLQKRYDLFPLSDEFAAVLELRTQHARSAGLEAELAATPPAPAAVAVPDWVEVLAESWDGCMYDAPGETIDIGASIRRAALAARFIRQPA